MAGRPAIFRQRDAQQLINAARRAGVARVDFKVGDSTAIVYINDTAEPVIDGEPSNSFDKIMQPHA
jgi:hypothetical protein